MESAWDEPNCPPQEGNVQLVSRLAQQDKVPWYRKPNLRLLYLLMFPACIGCEIMNGYIGTMVNGLQAVPSWLEYYNHPRSLSLGLIVSMYSLGSLAAVPFAPSVADNFGRRFPILLGGIVSIAGSVLQGSSLNLMMFIVARFILGLANVFCLVAVSTLIGELSYPKERPIIGGLCFTSYFIGAIAAAAVILGTFAMDFNWGWRIPSFLQIVPGLLQVYCIRFIPESPRWLIFMGRGREAFDILVKYHAEGDENSEFAQAEYTQIKEAVEGGQKTSGTWMSMLFIPGMRKRTIIATFLGLGTGWSGAGLISYFLSLILENIGIHDNRTKNIINLAYVSWKLVTSTLVVLVAAQYHRRKMYLACTISLLVVFISFTVASADYSLTDNQFSARIVLVLIFAFALAYNLAFGSLSYAFLTELFPFHARASGMAIYQWWGQGGMFCAQFMNPIGIDALGWRWYIVYCIWNALQIVFVYTMFPETSGRTLEELAFLFEEDRKMLGNDESQLLRDDGQIRTYGTIEG